MAEHIQEGDRAPIFSLKNERHELVSLDQLSGKWVVLYFYPKDDTPGCTQEACDFTDALGEFEGLDAVVVGISPDQPEKHAKFREKYGLKVMLLSDDIQTASKLYGVWGEKSMMGKKYMGITRSTFLINPKGKVAKVWRNVKVSGHVQEVRDALKALRRKGE